MRINIRSLDAELRQYLNGLRAERTKWQRRSGDYSPEYLLEKWRTAIAPYLAKGEGIAKQLEELEAVREAVHEYARSQVLPDAPLTPNAGTELAVARLVSRGAPEKLDTFYSTIKRHRGGVVATLYAEEAVARGWVTEEAVAAAVAYSEPDLDTEAAQAAGAVATWLSHVGKAMWAEVAEAGDPSGNYFRDQAVTTYPKFEDTMKRNLIVDTQTGKFEAVA